MENSRRNFIKQSGMLAAGLIVLPYIEGFASPVKKYGIQLYSLRDEFSKGVENVIKEVAKAGYATVEPYGYSVNKGFWGISPAEFKALLDKYNLKAPSSHYDFGTWERTQDESILKEYASVGKTLGHEYIVVPYINPGIFKTEEKVKAFAQKLNKAGAYFKNEGLKLAYHNHDFEFEKIGDTTAYQILIDSVDPTLVDFELDLYWAVRAKQDVLGMFKKNKGKITMWHIKDMDKVNPSKNTEVGNGSIDFKPFLKKAKLSGLKYAFVEQENFDIDPYESINRSSAFLKKII